MKRMESFSPGFRCSLGDLAFLGLAAVATWKSADFIGIWAAVIPFVVGHFFLFCNVFRVGTRRELAWTGIFIVNAGLCLSREIPSPVWLCLAQAPFSLAVLVLAVRDPGYHGLGSSLMSRGGPRPPTAG